MTNRRTFIQIAAATAAPVALGGMPALASPGTTHQFALFESTLAPANAFARRARSHGIPTVSIPEGDITHAWLTSVRPAWQRGRASIAGLTTPAALFCLEQLAFTHGLRVVFHVEHVLLPDGSVQHQVHRSPLSVNAATLRRAGDHWPQRLADSMLMQRLPRAPRPGPSLAALEPALPAGATLLSSWIIA